MSEIYLGRIVLTDRIIDRGYVAVSNGKIEAVGEGGGPSGAVTDFGDDLILPGAIDAQVHSRSQKDQEDFVWTTRSAAAGGITTIVDMPYDDGFLVCTADRLRQKMAEAEAQVRIDVGLYATIHPKDGAEHIDAMVAAGAVGFKFSTFETHADRFPRISPPLLHDCFAAIAPHGLIAGIHNESDEYVRASMASVRAQGLTDYRAHGLSRPPIAEALAMAEVYEIGASTGCSTHVVHCSIGRGYELCAAYRAQGHDATVEACIHYLMLSEEDDVARLGGKAKVNPPIRSRVEVEALWRHLAAGRVTIVSTDHVGWSEDRKSSPDMLANASGMPSLDLLYRLLLKGLDERGLSLSWAATLLAANPARLFRITDRKGALTPGCDADFVVMSRRTETYRAADSRHSFTGWSAYDGMSLPYKVAATYLRGEKVFDGDDVLAAPGFGRIVRPPVRQTSISHAA